MNSKLIFVAAALALGVAAASSTAQAGGPGGFAPNPHGGGGGPGGFAPNPPGGGGGGGSGGWGGGWGVVINPGYHGGYARVDDRISCRTGQRIVDRSGFSRVRVVECRGGTYTYKAKRGGNHYRVSVDAFDGAIVGRSRL